MIPRRPFRSRRPYFRTFRYRISSHSPSFLTFFPCISQSISLSNSQSHSPPPLYPKYHFGLVLVNMGMRLIRFADFIPLKGDVVMYLLLLLCLCYLFTFIPFISFVILVTSFRSTIVTDRLNSYLDEGRVRYLNIQRRLDDVLEMYIRSPFS